MKTSAVYPQKKTTATARRRGNAPATQSAQNFKWQQYFKDEHKHHNIGLALFNK